MTVEKIAVVASILTLAGIVKGVFGVGLPAVSMGLLALLMPPVEAAALLVVPALLTNVWQFATVPRVGQTAKRFAPMALMLAFGTAVGIAFLTTSSPWVPFALGVVLVLYACVGLFVAPLRVSSKSERRLSPVVGALTGMLNGATGVAAVPFVPYLNSLGLPRDTLIQAMGLMFCVCTLSLTTGLALTGNFHLQSLGASALALVPALAGMNVGRFIRNRVHADAFRRWFLIGLLMLGGYTATRAMVQL